MEIRIELLRLSARILLCNEKASSSYYICLFLERDVYEIKLPKNKLSVQIKIVRPETFLKKKINARHFYKFRPCFQS